ncbi:MAG: DNA methyltransferase, partial [Thermoanaerobaculia bacterium]
TGAVRHMFSHHVLKPERVPLEANLWGTPKSSGSFSTLFDRRILRAIEYCDDPFEIRVERRGKGLVSSKVFGLSERLSLAAIDGGLECSNKKRLALSLGDSSCIDLPDESVDAVITDPPFFDHVHYSELADFFFVWQRHILRSATAFSGDTTRSDSEVQNTDPAAFEERLCAVWKECHRVLKPTGLLVFTYHHSRSEGWRCLLHSLTAADLVVVAAHPIKAEMSVAQPKHQAINPVDLDVILVCRKRRTWTTPLRCERPNDAAREWARDQIARFVDVGRPVGKNDIRVILMAQLLCALSQCGAEVNPVEAFDRTINEVERSLERLVAEFASGPSRCT